MKRDGLRAYRALLRLFPTGFRLRHGEELEQLFTEMRSDWEAERGRVGARFWARLGWDTVTHAAAEWAGLISRPRNAPGRRGGGEVMSSLWTDARFALRQLMRQPMYGGMIVLLMACGIAGNAAVFRVFNGLFLKPLPFDEPGRLVDIDETNPTWDLEYMAVAYRDFDRWRAENTTFESMAAIDQGGGNLMTDGGVLRVSYLRATHDLDEVLRISPLMGRFFGPEEDDPDGPRAGLLSQGFWQQHFGGAEDVIGSTVSLNGYSIEVVGILPDEARFFGDADMWIPLRERPEDFNGWGLNAIGRMRDGVTIEQARADLMRVHKGMIPEFEVNEISSPVIDSLRDRYLGDYRLGSGLLLAAVAAVLLIACANIAGLMTVRAMARAPEMGVRRAMGAPRSRIVRQLLTESLILASIGATLGILLGVWGSELIISPLSEQFPSWVVFDLDLRFLGFTLLVTAGAAMLFGLAPALQASANSGRVSGRTTGSAGQKRATSLLVTGEVALALALLIVGGLSVLDVQRLGRTDPGFEADGLISYAIGLPTTRYENADARLAFADDYLDRIARIPDVQSAAITSGLPLNGHWGWFFQVEGAPARAEGEADPVVLNRVVSSDYFQTVGVQLLRGRGFEPRDGRDGELDVIVVNERFVQTHLAHVDDPIGVRLHPGTSVPDEDQSWMTIVGVARDVRHYGIDQEMRPGVYQPLPQVPLSGFQVALRTDGDVGAVMSAARATTAEVDVELPLFQVQTMTAVLEESLFTRRATSWLIGIFSAVTLLMAVAGIYGVISYSVGQQSREISIRMAMGAHSRAVLADVVWKGMRLVALGAIVGVAISLAGARTVSGILVGVSATNPVVYLVVTALVVVVAAAANYIPARRAARLDPARALRGD